MNNVTLEELIEKVRSYNKGNIDLIIKAYDYASKKHEGQKRQSGEPYIIHPLNVAFILAEMHADIDTICAGLLHDTIEDTDATREDIERDFNESIALLVEGVTKIGKMNFSSKQDCEHANTRKILISIAEDIRIIVVKLADRLHNMRTLQHMKGYKQKKKALETLEIFVPLAYYIGAYKIKNELSILSLKYLEPREYENLIEIRKEITKDSEKCIQDMLTTVKQLLDEHNIENEIRVRIKNIYSMEKKLNNGYTIPEIHDLITLKVIVDDVYTCYGTLGLIHSKYHVVNDKFRDYISSPKTNMYKSLHTTVFGADDKLVQFQIKTREMDRAASLGLAAFWDFDKDDARKTMQNELKNKYQFARSIIEIDKIFKDNGEFVDQVKRELFRDEIYVYTPKGDVIQLPEGSTPIDFAYKIGNSIGNSMIGALVNNSEVSLDYKLKNKDVVKILTNDLALGPNDDWDEKVTTSTAKKRIREYRKKQ
jgi:GTP pyrophosphokinase